MLVNDGTVVVVAETAVGRTIVVGTSEIIVVADIVDDVVLVRMGVSTCSA